MTGRSAATERLDSLNKAATETRHIMLISVRHLKRRGKDICREPQNQIN